jgi:hypothetical protein
MFFFVTSDSNPYARNVDSPGLPKLVQPSAQQLSLFGEL